MRATLHQWRMPRSGDPSVLVVPPLLSPRSRRAIRSFAAAPLPDNQTGEVVYHFFGLNYQAGVPDEAYLPDVYKMVIDISGDRKRVFVFRRAGCRRKMLQWYYGYLDKAAESEEIKSIRVWGTVGNKTDMVLEWVREHMPP